MPWNVRKRGRRWCVIKVGESQPVPGGCHDTRAEAVRHQRALYAGEAASAQTAGFGRTNALWHLFGPKEGTNMAFGDPQNVGLSGGVSVPQVIYTSSNAFNDIKIVPVDTAPYITSEPITINFSEPWQMEPEDSPTWEGILAIEGLPTSDGRYLVPGAISHRDLPLSLMCQNITAEEHNGAFVAGKITEIYRESRPDLGDGAIAVVGRGVFSSDEDGQRAQQWLDEEVLRHVSIDFAPTASYYMNRETRERIPDEELDMMSLFSGEYLRGFEGKIMGATICAFSAFEDATLEIVDVGDKMLIACAFPMRRALTASAAGLAPIAPPKEWFYEPETDGPCPLTVTPDGKVFGHLALWNQCHRAVATSCEMAPRSKSGYAYFHTGSLSTAEGEKINVGRITVGANGHASVSPYLGTNGAVKHYDETGMVGAFVRAIDGNYGIWLSGSVRSDCPAEKVRDMEANPPSGDWREENGRLELCAALSVPVAGFPVPRYEAALVASGFDERVVALVASGYQEPGPLTRADQRKFEILKKKARKALRPWES